MLEDGENVPSVALVDISDVVSEAEEVSGFSVYSLVVFVVSVVVLVSGAVVEVKNGVVSD